MPTNLYTHPYQCPHDGTTKWKVVDQSTGSVKQSGFSCHAEAKAYIRKSLAGRKA